jgi:dTDP-4-dehydrorhamnose reductase
MKIMICGGSGQVGNDCTDVLGNTHDVISYDKHHLDITDSVAVDDAIKRLSPEIVLNCAAFTRVDECETKRELAWKVNAEGPGNLARSLQKTGGRLIHISTDYVFDGLRKPPEPYTEYDKTEPLSYYGKTKLDGESEVRERDDNHIILRTAWVYGMNGHNFLKTILKLSMKSHGKEIRVVNDQYGSPTWSFRVAEQIEHLIKKNGRGTYHVTSEGYCTWYQLSKFFLDRMGIENRLEPCSTEEYPTPAIRPRNSILENRRLKEEGMNIMRHWQDDVGQFVGKFRTSLIEECEKSL